MKCECCGTEDDFYYVESPVEYIVFWCCNVCGYRNALRWKYGENRFVAEIMNSYVKANKILKDNWGR